jgi:hypothetical protein
MKKFTLKFRVITMKKIWFILMVLFLTAANFGLVLADDTVATELGDVEPTDRIGLVEPLVFNETVFNLAWTAHPDETYYAQEYLPEGENVETFDQMLAVHVFLRDIKPKEAVFEKAIQISTKLGKNSLVYFSGSADEKTYVLDFVVEEKKFGKRVLVEYDLYRYQEIDLGNEKTALMVIMYCKRSYGSDTKRFLKTLGDYKQGYRDEMSNMEIPVVTIANN